MSSEAAPETTRQPPHFVIEHRLDRVAGIGGAVWSLPHDGDLDGNLVRLAPGRAIEQHRNHDVDVLLIVREGGGDLTVDGDSYPLDDTTVALVPRGTMRSIAAGPDGVTYLSIHRRRGPLGVGPTRRA